MQADASIALWCQPREVWLLRCDFSLIISDNDVIWKHVLQRPSTSPSVTSLGSVTTTISSLASNYSRQLAAFCSSAQVSEAEHHHLEVSITTHSGNNKSRTSWKLVGTDWQPGPGFQTSCQIVAFATLLGCPTTCQPDLRTCDVEIDLSGWQLPTKVE